MINPTFRRPRVTSAFAVSISMLLYACGGGSKGGGADEAPSTATIMNPTTSVAGSATEPAPSLVPSSPVPNISSTPVGVAAAVTTSPAPALPALLEDAPGLSLPTKESPLVARVGAMNPQGVMQPTIQAVADGRWDNPSTWGGRVPAANDLVFVARDRTVELAGATASLAGMWVDGTVRFADADIALTSQYVLLTGRLQAGTPDRPYARSATITLTGTDTTQNIASMGTKFIGVAQGGMLSLHGERRLAWTQMTESAPAGSVSIALKDDASTWRAGDRIVLATASADPRHSEVVTVTQVAGNRVTFTPPLRHARPALVQTIEGKALDQRPSVGLLSRNIVIRGAEDSEAAGFGGHIMVMAGGAVQISGVEMTKMGQRGRFGRYPMHWHLAGDASHQYVSGSSVHDTFQRALVVHSTHNATIDGNVAYNIPNHAFVWAEDGDERGTRMTRNLGMLIRSPSEDGFAFRINNAFHGNSSQGEQRSAVFWGRSYDQHIIRGNVSAGSLDGFGFFFDLFTPAPFGDDEGGGLMFDGNTAHSTFKTLATGNQINYPEATTGHGLFISTGSSGKHEHRFSNFTGYQNVSGAWVEDRSTRLVDSILADNGVGVMVLRGVLERLTIVGDSDNPVAPPNLSASVVFNFPSAIQVAGSIHGGKRAPVILGATIVKQRGAGIMWDLDNISPDSYVQNVRFIDTPTRAVVETPHRFGFFPDSPIFGVTDATGVFAGGDQPSRIMMRDSPLADESCTPALQHGFWRCPTAGSLLLSAPANLTLVESSGLPTFLRGFGYSDASMPSGGAMSWVGNGRQYTVLGNARAKQDFKLSDVLGKRVDLALPAAGSATRVLIDGQNLSAASSLAALRGANRSGHFFDSTASTLHVRLVGTAERHEVSIDAPFVASSGVGREPVTPPAGLADGFTYAISKEDAKYSFRYSLPVGPSTDSRSTSSVIDLNTSRAALSTASAGDVTVLRGYVNAPTTGLYRFGLFGSDGGTALWVGDSYVHGEPSTFINSNWIRNGQITSQFGVFQPNGVIALRAGWHPVAALHAKLPGSTGASSLLLRWIPPGGGDTWTSPAFRSVP